MISHCLNDGCLIEVSKLLSIISVYDNYIGKYHTVSTRFALVITVWSYQCLPNFLMHVLFVLCNWLVGYQIEEVLSINPLFFSPHLSLTTPLYFFRQRCFLNHLIATVSSAILVQASPVDLSTLQVNLVVSLRLSLNAWYPAQLLLPLTTCECYLWPTQYIFINKF